MALCNLVLQAFPHSDLVHETEDASMTVILRVFLGILAVAFFAPSIASANFVETPNPQRRLIVFVHGLGNSGGKDVRMA